MKCAALLTLLLAGCAITPHVEDTPTSDETRPLKPLGAEHYVSLLHWPYDNLLYQTGLHWILKHPDEAHPVLVAHLDDKGLGYLHIPDVLAMLGRAEGIPPLERALWDDDGFVVAGSGLALGNHPHEDAFAALIRGTQPNATPEVITWAVEGLRNRRDPAACPALIPLLHRDESSLRFHVLRASAELGCISSAEIAPFRNDPQPDVAALAHALGSTSGQRRKESP